jgi:ABC-type sugar transport system substrate-binding protein/anti-anti-sigma regulatory factor
MTGFESPENIHIAFSYFGPHFGFFWSIVSQCAREEAKRLGIRLSSVPVASVANQVAALQQLIRDQVDALIVAPLYPADPELIAAAKQATAAGIPIIALDSEIRGCKMACVIRSKDDRGAEMAAEHLFRRLGGKGKLANLQGDMRAQAAAQRSEGVHRALKRYPDVQLVFEAGGDWTRTTAADLMRQALEACPDIQAVVAGSDMTALGASDVIAEAGRTGQILVAGFDALPEALVAIHNGHMHVTVSRSMASMAREALTAALRALRREEVPPLLLTEVALVTADNLLEPVAETLGLMPEVLNALTESHEAQRSLQQEVIEVQRRAIQELSTPVIPLIERIIIMPLIGSIDTLRASDIMRALLRGIREHRARVVILDITGVPLVDTAVANHLIKAMQAARLKGARTIITGISDAVAETMVDLGVDWGDFETLADLQTGLIAALGSVGLKLSRG